MDRRIVESYLSLLCETCGAGGAHLRITCTAGEETMTLIDLGSRPSPHDEAPMGDAARQMTFALASEGAAAPHARGGKRAGAGTSYAVEDWARPAFHGEGGSGWDLVHRFDTRDWLIRGILRGMTVELLLVFDGGEIRRRLELVWPFLAFLGNLLANVDIDTAAAPPLGGGSDPPFDPPLVGVSAAMLDLKRRIRSLADASIPVLIEGESGTGKEIVARNLHRLGGRAQKPLVIVNCMELPETLLQSELFGHLKGAFTGAAKDRMGLVESANGGTLFLDEIGEMPLTQQAALLRVLQEREVRRIGDSARRRVDVRFIFATNRDLAGCVEKGRFREDLYFRVSAVRLSLPPLRRRREDIAPLVSHFLAQHAERGGTITGFSPAALCRILSYRWPGNVRELKNEIERIVALHGGAKTVTVDMLSCEIREAPPGPERAENSPHESLRSAVDRLERRLISEALACTGGNRTRAAAVLGVSRQGLLKKMRRYGIRAGAERER